MAKRITAGMESEIEKLALAAAAYYRGHRSDMSDAEFDERWKRARLKAPDHPFFKSVGAPPSGERKAKHIARMGSLENIMDSEEEFTKWFNATNQKARKAANVPASFHLNFVIQHKVDGAAIELIYQDGYFIQAITRGDGVEGEDVTANVQRSLDPFFPRRLDRRRASQPKGRISVLAEAVIFKNTWMEHFNGDATARASVAGTLGRKDGARAEHLRFVAYGWKHENADNNRYATEMSALDLLCRWGFRTVSSESSQTAAGLWQHHRCIEHNREFFETSGLFGYEIDGSVVKLDCIDTQEKLGARDGRPHAQRAIKFPPRGADAVVRDVRWQVGMERVTPVLEIKPVRVSGVEITNVTLHNVAQFKELNLGKGDVVRIVRSGDVIPMITGVVGRKNTERFTAPKDCPECGRMLTKSGKFLVCGAYECAGRTQQVVENWCKKRNILSIGPAILAAIVGEVSHDGEAFTAADLYEIDYNTLSRLETESETGKRVRIGKNAETILSEIEKSRDVTLADFFGSLGIPGVGRSRWKKIIEHFGSHNYKDYFPLRTLSVLKNTGKGMYDYTSAPGVGESVAYTIAQWMDENWQMVERLAAHMRFKTPQKASSDAMAGRVLVFSGDGGIKRDKLTQIAIDNGGIVRTSMTNDVNLLVLADASSSSTKAKKARERGIEIMDVAAFLKICQWDVSGY